MDLQDIVKYVNGDLLSDVISRIEITNKEEETLINEYKKSAAWLVDTLNHNVKPRHTLPVIVSKLTAVITELANTTNRRNTSINTKMTLISKLLEKLKVSMSSEVAIF